MDLYSHYSYTDSAGEFVYIDDLVQRFSTETLDPIQANFNNIYYAMNSVFVVWTADGWNSIMNGHVIPYNKKWGGHTIYFMFIFTLGNRVLLNLFVAVMLSNFEPEEPEDQIFVKKKNDDEEPEAVGDKPVQLELYQRIFSKNTAEKIKAEFLAFIGYKKTVE